MCRMLILRRAIGALLGNGNDSDESRYPHNPAASFTEKCLSAGRHRTNASVSITANCQRPCLAQGGDCSNSPTETDMQPFYWPTGHLL